MFKQFARNILRFLGNKLLFIVINALCYTIKVKREIPEETDELIKSGDPVVIAFWHGTMLLPWYEFRGERASAIISQSKDGELLARVLEKWNYKVERGSSSKDGKEVLNNLVAKAKDGSVITITPDGPRGPRHEMKPGAVIAAKKAGVPLVLVGAAYKKFFQFKSWDKFRMPKFFSKTVLVYSKPELIDISLDYDSTSGVIKRKEAELNGLQETAEEICLNI